MINGGIFCLPFVIDRAGLLPVEINIGQSVDESKQATDISNKPSIDSGIRSHHAVSS